MIEGAPIGDRVYIYREVPADLDCSGPVLINRESGVVEFVLPQPQEDSKHAKYYELNLGKSVNKKMKPKHPYSAKAVSRTRTGLRNAYSKIRNG